MGRVNKRNNNRRFDKKETKDNSVRGKDTKPQHTSNDVAWYAKSPQLINDVGSLSFYSALGNQLDMGYATKYSGNVTGVMPADRVPGIMALDVHIGVGVANDASDPMNIAANLVYAETRRKNSGSWTYTYPSLMMYLLAMDSIYCMYNDYKRLYGVLSLYSAYNKYAPRGIVQAMGYDFDDLIEHVNDLRAYLNSICGAINSKKVPATMDIMVRHSMMFSNIYADSDSPKAQLYVFKRDNYYKYDEWSEPAQLTNTNINLAKLTFNDMVTQLNEALNLINLSQDCAVMSGDIEKAFEGNVFKVTPVEDYYTVVPTFDIKVLNQIHNAVIVGEISSNITENINDKQYCLLYKPAFESNSPGYMSNVMLDMITGDTSPEMVVEATRLVPTFKTEAKVQGKNSYVYTIDRIGSECICGARIYIMNDEGNFISGEIKSHYRLTSLETDAATTISVAAHLEKFRYHPSVTMWIVPDLTNPSSAQVVGMFYEANLYTVIEAGTLNKMHDAALLSEFGVISK